MRQACRHRASRECVCLFFFFFFFGGGEEGGEGESVFKTYRNVRGQAFLESLTSNILMLIFKNTHLTATSCDPIVISRFLCFNECRLQIFCVCGLFFSFFFFLFSLFFFLGGGGV